MRDALDLSLEQVSKALKALGREDVKSTSTNTISRWENGKLSPPMAYLEWLADRAGVPVRVLVEGASDQVTREAMAFRKVTALVDRLRATESDGDPEAHLKRKNRRRKRARGRSDGEEGGPDVGTAGGG